MICWKYANTQHRATSKTRNRTSWGYFWDTWTPPRSRLDPTSMHNSNGRDLITLIDRVRVPKVLCKMLGRWDRHRRWEMKQTCCTTIQCVRNEQFEIEYWQFQSPNKIWYDMFIMLMIIWWNDKLINIQLRQTRIMN